MNKILQITLLTAIMATSGFAAEAATAEGLAATAGQDSGIATTESATPNSDSGVAAQNIDSTSTEMQLGSGSTGTDGKCCSFCCTLKYSLLIGGVFVLSKTPCFRDFMGQFFGAPSFAPPMPPAPMMVYMPVPQDPRFCPKSGKPGNH